MNKYRFMRLSYFPPFAVALLFIACEPDLEKVNEITKKDTLPLAEAKNVELIYSDSARVKVLVKGKQLKRYAGENPYAKITGGAEVIFYDDELNVESRLTSKTITSHEKQKRLEAETDVEVINSKGEKLNSEHLIWDQEQKKIYTNTFVRITTADEVIMGDGFEADETFSRYRIKNIKGTINIKTDEKDSTDT